MNLQEWANLLWQFVNDSYVVTKPIYLCIDPLALQTLANGYYPEGKYTPEMAKVDFLAACSARVRCGNERAVLDESVFLPSDNGRSLVICFAVQQILAAEMMIHDDRGSSDAYYPRYRQILGIAVDDVGRCPIEYPQFQKIWSTLRCELLSLPNATPSLITFAEGKGRKNKFRAFPISQALLNLESLSIIVGKIPNLEFLSNEILIHEIRRISYTFPKQSQIKVYIDAIVPSLIEQVRVYESTYSSENSPHTSKSKVSIVADSDNFFVYIVEEGWDDVYQLGYRLKDNAVVVDIQIDVKLKDYFGANNVLAFRDATASDFGGCDWKDVRNTGDLSLIVYQEDNKSPLTNDLGIDWEELFEPVKANLPSGYCMQVFSGSEQWDRNLGVGNGISQPASTAGQIILVGGLLVDKRSNIYLADIPPTGLKYGGKDVSPSTAIRVNGDNQSVANFFDRISTSGVLKDFLVEFGGSKLKFGLVRHRNMQEPARIGHEIVDGYATASADTVDNQRQCIEHLALKNISVTDVCVYQAVSSSDLVKHLSIERSRWIACLPTITDFLVSMTDNILKNHPLHEHFLRQLRNSRKIPPTLYLLLRRSGTIEEYHPKQLLLPATGEYSGLS